MNDSGLGVLVDTNIVLDTMLERTPWNIEALPIWLAADRGELTLFFTASSLTDIFYIVRKLRDRDTARKVVQRCLERLFILPVDNMVLRSALVLPIPDFEDALQVACAVQCGLDAIVTRDPKGFVDSPIRVFSPVEFVNDRGYVKSPS